MTPLCAVSTQILRSEHWPLPLDYLGAHILQSRLNLCDIDILAPGLFAFTAGLLVLRRGCEGIRHCAVQIRVLGTATANSVLLIRFTKSSQWACVENQMRRTGIGSSGVRSRAKASHESWSKGTSYPDNAPQHPKTHDHPPLRPKLASLLLFGSAGEYGSSVKMAQAGYSNPLKKFK
jgi:hypothetical protein